jgi:diacylglycerol O-acyltransferase
MVVNTVLWFDAPVDQASVLQMFQDRVVWRFRRFRQRVADPVLTLAPWAAPEWVGDADFALAEHVSRTRLPAPGDQRALQRAASEPYSAHRLVHGSPRSAKAVRRSCTARV